jgi:hypothetical protein
MTRLQIAMRQSEIQNRQSKINRAVGRYARALARGVNSSRVDGKAGAQAGNYRSAYERNELRAEQARQVLMRHGIPPIQFVAYRNFTLRVDKLGREHGGETLWMLVEQAIERWTALGLDPAVLRAVYKEVFEIRL